MNSEQPTPRVVPQGLDAIGSGSSGGSDGKATMWSGFINLTNTIVGAGMLGLPGAFAGTGRVGGTILILLSAFFSAHGLVLLSKAAQRSGLPCSFFQWLEQQSHSTPF